MSGQVRLVIGLDSMHGVGYSYRQCCYIGYWCNEDDGEVSGGNCSEELQFVIAQTLDIVGDSFRSGFGCRVRRMIGHQSIMYRF